MKGILFVLLLAFLTGCATTNQLTLAEFDQEPSQKLPPISIFFKQPSDFFQQDCVAFDQRSILHHCKLNTVDLHKFYDEIKRSEFFGDVYYANKEVDYRLLLTTGIYNVEGGDDLGSAFVAGATLMLAPMVISADIKVDARLYWHNYELKRFEYNLPIEFRASLLSLDQDSDRDIAKSISSHILRDIQGSNLFSAEFLAHKIGATDYKNNLNYPKESGSYEFDFFHAYNHPFLGSQIRYKNLTNAIDYVDVFIYPIRSSRWLDEKNEWLKKEAGNAKKDIKLMHERQGIKNAEFGGQQFIKIRVDGVASQALYFNHGYTDTLGNAFDSRTYFVIVKDKFIKLRHTALDGTVSDNEIEQFLKWFLKVSVIPGESVFMAEVRKQWRDNENL